MVARCTCEQAVIAKLAELIRWTNVRAVGGLISHRELEKRLMGDIAALRLRAKPKRSK